MLEAVGTVVRVEGARAWVRTRRMSACGTCAEREGCGTGSLARVLGARENLFEVDNSAGAGPGDEVTLGFPGGAFLGIVALVYLLPIVLFAGGAGLGTLHSEGAAIAAGLSGLGLGLFIVHRVSRRVGQFRRLRPVILDAGPVMDQARGGEASCGKRHPES